MIMMMLIILAIPMVFVQPLMAAIISCLLGIVKHIKCTVAGMHWSNITHSFFILFQIYTKATNT